MRSIAVFALLACALVLPVANAQSDGCMTALEVLEDTPALSNLLTVVQAANLETSLNTSLRVTLFAPNNAALQPVLDRSNETAIVDALASIILYHIVPGQVFTIGDVLNTFAAANASTIGPLQTAAVQLPPSCGVTTLSLEDDNSGSILVVAAESSAEVVTPDVPICGGIVHIMDETLLPCELPPVPTDGPSGTPTASPTDAPTATPVPTDGATPTPTPTDDARFGSGLAMSLLGTVFISALAVLA